MRIRYRGHSLDLRLTRESLTVREPERGAAPINFGFKDEVYEFAGGTRVFMLGRAQHEIRLNRTGFHHGVHEGHQIRALRDLCGEIWLTALVTETSVRSHEESRRCVRCQRRRPGSSEAARGKVSRPSRSYPRRHHHHRRRRYHSSRRATDPVHRAPYGRGRRSPGEPAGFQGHCSDHRRGGTRRPRQHDLQQHSSKLRARQGRGGGDGNADPGGADCRDAGSSVRPSQARCCGCAN